MTGQSTRLRAILLGPLLALLLAGCSADPTSPQDPAQPAVAPADGADTQTGAEPGSAAEDAAPSEASDAPFGRPMRVVVIGDVSDLDVQLARSPPERLLAQARATGLVRRDGTGRIAPGLAESWRISDDGLSYIFRLRQVSWPDGELLSSDDVVTSVRRFIRNGKFHAIKPLLFAMKNAEKVAAGRMRTSELGVRALTEDVVEFVLDEPQPALLGLLADPAMAIVKEQRNRSGRLTGVETLGPYVLAPEVPPAPGAAARNFVLSIPETVDPDSPAQVPSGMALPAVREITLTTLPGTTLALNRFRAGEADIVYGTLNSGLAAARTIGIAGVLKIEQVYGTYGYIFNTRKPPFDNVRLRRALASLIDRNAIVGRTIGVNALQATSSLVPGNLPGYASTATPGWLALPTADRQAEARTVLEDAGYTAENPLVIEVSTVDSPDDRAVFDSMIEAWRLLPIRLEVVSRTERLLTQKVNAGEFQLAQDMMLSPSGSPDPFLRRFTCGASQNVSGYCSEAADALFSKAMATGNVAERGAILRQAEQLMVDDAPMISLFIPVRWALVSTGVTGWSDNPSSSHPLTELGWVAAP